MGIIALTHDVDRLNLMEPSVFHGVLSIVRWGVVNFCYRVLVRDVSYADIALSASCYQRSLERMAEMEAEVGVRSTFFVATRNHWRGCHPSGRVAPFGRSIGYSIRDLTYLRGLQRAGWEIGLHGVRAFESVELAKEEKDALEDFLSARVIGHRSHYLYMNERSISHLREAGFRYDSSYLGSIPPHAKGFSYPIKFMDSAIIRDFRPICADITSAIERLLNYDSGAVMVVLWHTNVLGYPFQLDQAYKRFLDLALARGFRIEPLSRAIAAMEG